MKLNSSYEIILGALFGNTRLAGVAYAFTNGVPVTETQRSLSGVVGTAEIDSYYFEADVEGRMKTLWVFATIGDGINSIKYDAIGLVSNTGLLFVGESLPDYVETTAKKSVKIKVEL